MQIRADGEALDTDSRDPGARRRPARRDADARREEIIQAAAQLIEAKGYVQTTIDDIAAEIGQSKGTIYYYFATKEDILYQIHLRSIEHSLAFTREILASSGTSRERVRLLFRHTLEFVKENKPYATIFLEANRYLRGPKFDLVRQKRAEFEHLIGSIFTLGIEAGELRDLDPRLATLSLLGQVTWAFVWYDSTNPRSLAEVVEMFAQLFLDGLAAPGGTRG